MHSRWVQFTALLAFAACVFAASRLQPQINEGRKDLDMMGQTDVLENTPPEYSFAIQAFGAFRGILTNLAFIRAEEYKRQGRYYDAMQLANWICQLQPRFPAVWVYNSWNMAWNISVTTYTPEERWNWVYNGVKLIRDKGLMYSPRSIDLYKQIAWIFVNKMSATTDEFHMAYKRNWAWRMHLILGPPPDPIHERKSFEDLAAVREGIGQDELYKAALEEAEKRDKRNRERFDKGQLIEIFIPSEQEAQLDTPETTDAYFQEGYGLATQAVWEYLRGIADAPRTLAALYEQHPEAQQLVADLRSIGVPIDDDKLEEDTYWRDEGLAFRFFYPYRILTDPPGLRAEVVDEVGAASGIGAAAAERAYREQIKQTLRIGEEWPARDALVQHLQGEVLRDVYKLEPASMAEITATFGPIDWRVVDAHSLYWVREGLLAGKESLNEFGNDKTNTLRLIFFSLRNLMLRNRLIFEPYSRDINNAYLNFTPDFNFIEPMHQAYLHYGRMVDPEPEILGAGRTYRTGHTNFLIEAVMMLYFSGRERQAQHYYDYLRSTYNTNWDGTMNSQFLVPLEEFAWGYFQENVSWRNVRSAINAFLVQGFEALTVNDWRQFRKRTEMARRIHNEYNESQSRDNVGKMKLPPFQDFQEDVLAEYYRQPAPSEYFTLEKARLWRNLPPALRLAVYDRILPIVSAECDRFDFELEKAFPEPAGLEEYRKERGSRETDFEQSDVETPAQQM